MTIYIDLCDCLFFKYFSICFYMFLCMFYFVGFYLFPFSDAEGM